MEMKDCSGSSGPPMVHPTVRPRVLNCALSIAVKLFEPWALFIVYTGGLGQPSLVMKFIQLSDQFGLSNFVSWLIARVHSVSFCSHHFCKVMNPRSSRSEDGEKCQNWVKHEFVIFMAGCLLTFPCSSCSSTRRWG